MQPPAYRSAGPLLRVLSHGVGMGVRVGEDRLAVITRLQLLFPGDLTPQGAGWERTQRPTAAPPRLRGPGRGLISLSRHRQWFVQYSQGSAGGVQTPAPALRLTSAVAPRHVLSLSEPPNGDNTRIFLWGQHGCSAAGPALQIKGAECESLGQTRATWSGPALRRTFQVRTRKPALGPSAPCWGYRSHHLVILIPNRPSQATTVMPRAQITTTLPRS